MAQCYSNIVSGESLFLKSLCKLSKLIARTTEHSPKLGVFDDLTVGD
jgi:hypothetical protein